MRAQIADSRPETLLPLTSLRFAAAFMIFLHHLREFVPNATLSAIGVATNQGVSFFFVLSGFVLMHVYTQRPTPTRAFYIARFARIFPAHVAAMFLLLLALPLAAARGETLSTPMTVVSLVAKLFMVDAWAPLRATFQSWNNVSWSLSNEIVFYAAFPWLMARMQRSGTSTLLLVGGVSLGTYAAGVGLGLPLLDGDDMTATLFNLGSYHPLARGFEFALGMAAYLGWRRGVAPLRLPVSAWTAIEAGAFATVAFWLALAAPAIASVAPGAVFIWFHASGSAWVFAILIVALAAGRGAIGRALSLRPFVALGEISFAFYLVHEIVMRAFQLHFGDPTSWVGMLAVSLYFAGLLHFAVEEPMRRRILRALARSPANALEIGRAVTAIPDQKVPTR